MATSRRRRPSRTTIRLRDACAAAMRWLGLSLSSLRLSILLVTLLLVWQLWIHSSPSAHKFGFGFLPRRLWNPVTDQFGALPFIYGTVLTSFLALLISVPLGVGAAIYLSELAPPRLSNALTFLVELLAAVPSVIYGLAGHLHAGSSDADYDRTGSEGTFGFSAAVSRPDLRCRLSDGRPDSGHHDVPVHHFRVARSADGGAARTAGSRSGAGRHPMGIHLAGGGAVRALGHYGFDFSGSGARAGRDHGGYHGDR